MVNKKIINKSKLESYFKVFIVLCNWILELNSYRIWSNKDCLLSLNSKIHSRVCSKMTIHSNDTLHCIAEILFTMSNFVRPSNGTNKHFYCNGLHVSLFLHLILPSIQWISLFLIPSLNTKWSVPTFRKAMANLTTNFMVS